SDVCSSDLRCAQIVDHLPDCGRCGIYPINVAKRHCGRMMVDIDDELVFQAGQSWPIHVTTLDDKSRIVPFGHIVLDYHRIRCREDIVSRWHPVAKHYIGFFAECSQHPVESQP